MTQRTWRHLAQGAALASIVLPLGGCGSENASEGSTLEVGGQMQTMVFLDPNEPGPTANQGEPTANAMASPADGSPGGGSAMAQDPGTTSNANTPASGAEQMGGMMNPQSPPQSMGGTPAPLPEPGGPNPGVGDIIFTEIMYNPNGADRGNEWFELHNTTNRQLTLEDCMLSDETAMVPTGELVLEPADAGRGSFLIFANSFNAPILGNVNVDGVFDFTLNNNGDRLTLACGGVVIDEVDYDINFNQSRESSSFPRTDGFSIALDPMRMTADENDAGANWCVSRAPFIEQPSVQFGTPGAMNSVCDAPVETCELAGPLDFPGARYRDVVEVYGRIKQQGLTTRSPQNNAVGLIRAEFGYVLASEAMDPDNWIWFYAGPQPNYNATQENQVGYDQYVADWTVPRPEQYAYGFRFSVDGGRTWTTCEGQGALTAQPPENPCTPNPCRQPDGIPACEGDTAIQFQVPGDCTPNVDGLEACVYPRSEVDCASMNQVCFRGQCFDEAPTPPAANEIVLTELMYNPDDAPSGEDGGPVDGLRNAEKTAEWIEVYNPTDTPKDLSGCHLVDVDPNRMPMPEGEPTIIENLVVDARSYAVFARSIDPARNGGLVADHVFGFSLTNRGDTIRIACGEPGERVVIDEVTYQDNGADRGRAQARSIALHGDYLDAMANDDPNAWCLANDREYFDNPPHYGTPGMVNPPCDRCSSVMCDSPPPVSCDGDQVVTYSSEGQCMNMGLEAVCTYTPTRTACPAGFSCLDGGCSPEGAREPVVGDLVISEIMANPNAVSDADGEWFEIHNTTTDPLLLSKCTVADDAFDVRGLAVPETGAYIEANGYLVFARSVNPEENGGIMDARPFGFGLRNGGDVLVIRCAAVEFDRVDYGAADFRGDAKGVALQLSPERLSSAENDAADAWCSADAIYPEGGTERGTPGAANTPCP
ncbi:MAG: lamin tail domain-containing protein [Myxococcota bacterium]|nr:lamin tail domain-containing protein [Myxococcota bacterium]